MKFTGERLVPKDKTCGSETEIYKEHIARYQFAKKFINNNNIILDIACGTGYGTQMLCENISCLAYGCDISEETINYAKQNYSTLNIKFEVMDATKLLFPENFFDCIICFETIEHLENPEKSIMEFVRVLKDNGIIIISTPNKNISLKNKSENEFHEHEFTRDEFLKILSKYFASTELYSQKLIIKPTLKEKILKFILSSTFKVTKYDKINLRHKLLKKGIGNHLYKSANVSYREPIVIPYDDTHLPQNFIAVSLKNKNHKG